MDGTGRHDLILKLTDLIERDRDYLVKLESLDNGKPLGHEGQYGSAGDVHIVIQFYRYFAGWADNLAGSTIFVDGNVFRYIRKEHMGVCGCAIPWNFPLVVQAWKLPPALAASCTVVLKTSAKMPPTALYISRLVQKQDFHSVSSIPCQALVRLLENT